MSIKIKPPPAISFTEGLRAAPRDGEIIICHAPGLWNSPRLFYWFSRNDPNLPNKFGMWRTWPEDAPAEWLSEGRYPGIVFARTGYKYDEYAVDTS